MNPEKELHQEMEAQLRAKNLFIKDILDAIAHPFCVINAENYHVELANSAAYRGRQRGDVTCYQLLHGSEQPCSLDEYLCPLHEIKKTKKAVIMEHLHVNREGEFQFVEVHGFPILDTAGNVAKVIEYTLDITQRKQYEEALRESEAIWRSVVDTSPDHILMLDTDLKIQSANFASPGLTVDDLIGTALYTYVDEHRQAKVKKILESVLRTGEPSQYETVYHSPDKDDIYYETNVAARRLADSNEIVGLTLNSRDISERKRMDLEKQELTHALGERVKELSCLYNISKLVMTPDISLDEILQGVADLIPPSWQYPEITCARVVLKGQDFRTENYQESDWKQTANVYVYSERSGFVEVCYREEKPEMDEGPFLKEERNLIDAIAERLGRISERMRTEKRIRQNELQLAAVQERERIGRELHDDLAQVIASVSTQAQAAMTYLEQDENHKIMAILEQLIQLAQEAQTDVRRYILGIRDPSRISRESTQSLTSFFAILERYLEALRSRYGLVTQVSLPDDWLESPFTPEVETQLLRIIQEALANVSKHAGVNNARLLFTKYADGVQVIISDEGCGFEITHTSTELRRDDDLGHFGLEIMQERADAIGGQVEVRSRPGQGTSIIVHLPQTLSQTQTPIGKGVKVLLVDDHPLYLEGLRSMLVSRGFHIVGSAYDGLQAQSLANDLQPDLILMDVQMPLCDGLEATKRIKETLPETKIVMLTVASTENKLFDALKYGASGYLLKSLDGGQFFSLLASVLDGQTVLSPELASMVLMEFVHGDIEPASNTDELVTLTTRQNEVLKLTAQGLSNKEIASRLNVTDATVKYHVSQILERLHLKSRYQLVRYNEERGLTSQ